MCSFRISSLVLGVLLMLLASPRAGSGGSQENGPGKDSKPLGALNAWLGRLPDVPKEGFDRKTVALDDGGVRRLLPGHAFYSVYFYKDAPRPGPLSEPLNLHNLFAVRPDGAVVLFKDKEHLAEFLKSKLGPLQGDDQIRAAALACLQVAEGFFQDGHYKLEATEPVSIEHERGQVTALARSLAQNRDQGGVTLKLTVGDAGKVSNVELGTTLRPSRGRRR
jgi:hypothetical protein